MPIITAKFRRIARDLTAVLTSAPVSAAYPKRKAVAKLTCDARLAIVRRFREYSGCAVGKVRQAVGWRNAQVVPLFSREDWN
jgi:hypothetical protein